MSWRENQRVVTGVAYGSGCYLSWGLFPLYFHALAGVPAFEVLSNRIAWSAVFLALLITWSRRWPEVISRLCAPRALPTLAVTALLISANWLIYIWAVGAGHTVEASLGYFVNPLVTVALGVIVLRDRLTRLQAAAIALAGLGVLSLIIRAGRIPWVALGLALTFALYGLFRKRLAIDSVAGLMGEVGILAPLALLNMGRLHVSGVSHLGAGVSHTVLLALSGVITAIPLLWFAKSVDRLRLSTVGLLQYLNPSLQLAIAVFVFGDRFTAAHAFAFGCIWVSLTIYTYEALALARRGQPKVGAGERPEAAG